MEVRFRIRDLATGRVIAAAGRAQLDRGAQADVRATKPVPPGPVLDAAGAECPPR